MYTKNLKETILIQPALRGYTSLKIITGYTDTDFISQHLIELADLAKDQKIKSISVEMILGMIDSNALTERKHNRIKSIIDNINSGKNKVKFICRYKHLGTDIHSKVYLWLKDNLPKKAFCGSANYSENAFFNRRECMVICNATKANEYFEQLKKDTISSIDPSIKKKILFSKKTQSKEDNDKDCLENLTWKMFENRKPKSVCEISLLKANGKETGYGSGLNWGIRRNGTKRDRDQAYIPYNASDKIENFFPLKKHPYEKNNPLFKVVPKGFPPFFMRIAQAGNKGIHTAENNALLGKFFREKLGVPSGTFITKKMLEKYGATKVIFKKYDNGIFVMDF